MSHDLGEAARAIAASQRLVVLTGAGVSKESGIPTFRDALDGLWAQYDPEQLATPEAFRRNPKLVWDWYEYRRGLIAGARPNPGHYALVDLEKRLPQVVIVTQNIDGLHHMAGSQNVIELHGSIRRSKCFANCQGDPTLVNVEELAWDHDSGPPQCPHCGAWVRPDVVWFHESLPAPALGRAIHLSETADVILVIGTSGLVQPAASLPFVGKRAGARLVEVNPGWSGVTQIADWYLAGPSGVILPQLVAAMPEPPHE